MLDVDPLEIADKNFYYGEDVQIVVIPATAVESVYLKWLWHPTRFVI